MQVTAKRYSDEKLEMFKNHIHAALDKVRLEAASLKTRLDELETRSADAGGHSYGETGKSQEQREMLTRQYVRQAERIHALEYALGRIANKTYGVDERTGDLIDEARLLANLIATSAI